MEKLFEHQATLMLFLIFFVPGFISLKVYDLLVPGERRDFSRSFLDAVAYSSLNFGVLLPLIYVMSTEQLNPWLWIVAAFVVLVGCPVIWPFAILRVRRIPAIRRRVVNPIARVWDCVFEARIPYWVIIHLKDQRRIGGVYSTRSFASSAPAEREIFLEEVWNLDASGAFVDSVGDSAGILVNGEEILALEFFRYN